MIFRVVLIVFAGLAAMVVAFAVLDTAHKGGEIRSTSSTLR